MTEADRIAHPWGERVPYGRHGTWPARVDTFLAEGVASGAVERWVQSASILHSDGDAMDIAVADGRMVGVRGRAVDRVNRGRLGPKDLFAWQANASGDRLTRPLVRRDGRLVETDWDTAMELVAARSRELLRERGPGSIGFYTSGQLFLEEYYTLAVLARAGIGTPHLDGNTRLCTATAAEALKETFGCDGQPGSYDDFDHADVVALFGHNIAETQPVQWMRLLDRMEGADPPRLLCVDPRPTRVARHAAVHLAPRVGTNVALLDALLHETIRHERIDRDFIAAHTVGFEELAERVAGCTPAWAAAICDVPAARIEEAAELVGTADALTSTVLQGVYQSHQATAAAVQVNNLHLIRGMLGRPGAGLLQMNGQPTAQNTRECGADGDLPGFRNWQNDAHVAELAQLWNVEPATIPHYAPPTHAMQMFRYAEQGSLRMLWISGTNPAVSLPELARIRSVLTQKRLFTVVQDLFLTETAQLADVVLPAATWGEKTGTLTNADRTVHLSDKAVEPPGEARPDLDIFLDYARRMDFRDKDGGPLITWHDPSPRSRRGSGAAPAAPATTPVCPTPSCAAPAASSGRATRTPRGHAPALHRRHHLGPPGRVRELRQGPGDGRRERGGGVPLPQPGRQGGPQGGHVPAAARDARRGAPVPADHGRTVYHFHTRTKTGRAPQLDAAAPDVWVEISVTDAQRLGLGEGDLVDVTTARGALRGRLRVTDIRQGLLFVPFHYGYWDTEAGSGPGPGTPGRAANETTVTDWDPVSKQPLFKTSAAALTLVARGDGSPSPAPTTTASAPAEDAVVPPTAATAAGAAAETGQEPTAFPHDPQGGAS